MSDPAKELMSISYKGAVVSSFSDEVVIAFETEDDIVEHTYTRDQFLDGKLPEEDTRVIVRCILTEEKERPVIENPCEDDLIDLRSHRKNVIEGSHTF